MQKAVALHQQGDLDGAEILYRGILEASPAEPDALLNLSTLHGQRGELEKAETLLAKLTLVHPKLAQGQFAFGNILFRQGKPKEAADRFAQAVKLAPNDLAAHTNNAKLQYDTGNYAAAIPSLKFLLKRDPQNAEIELNLGMAHEFLDQYREAIDSYDRYRALVPAKWALATFTMAQHELLIGNYERGLELFEHRWQLDEFKPAIRQFGAPLWLGDENLKGKTILITPEQGFGDTLQFARYVPLLEKMGANVLLEVKPPLMSLTRSLSSTMTLIEHGKPLPHYDFHCPVMSLPRAFRTTLETIPNTVPYLSVSEEKKRHWSSKLGPKTKPRIGLVWSGAPTNFLNQRRSVPLAELVPLFELPFEFHSLQKDILVEDRLALSILTDQNKLQMHGETVETFEDTAAIVEEMDLIISTCTSLSHLAGSLAKPLWMLLSDRPDWRWHLGRSDSPWYPTAKLFRQRTRDDWSSVIEQVIEALNTL